jgi:hypothetical protein
VQAFQHSCTIRRAGYRRYPRDSGRLTSRAARTPHSTPAGGYTAKIAGFM